MTKMTAAERGQRLMRGGHLKRLRLKLGLTPTTMASYLYVSPATYRSWEEAGPDKRMWTETAERLDRFYTAASRQMQVLKENGHNLKKMVPLQHVAAQLGVPQEVLTQRYREGVIEAVDLGVLGTWMLKADVKKLEY
jgi:DNA-binding transcriptional regulator YiaG